jgi:hypothetical protein
LDGVTFCLKEQVREYMLFFYTTFQSIAGPYYTYIRIIMLINILYVEFIGTEVEDITLVVLPHILRVLECPQYRLPLPQ